MEIAHAATYGFGIYQSLHAEKPSPYPPLPHGAIRAGRILDI
jgi:hypothetical protein